MRSVDEDVLTKLFVIDPFVGKWMMNIETASYSYIVTRSNEPDLYYCLAMRGNRLEVDVYWHHDLCDWYVEKELKLTPGQQTEFKAKLELVLFGRSKLEFACQ